MTAIKRVDVAVLIDRSHQCPSLRISKEDRCGLEAESIAQVRCWSLPLLFEDQRCSIQAIDRLGKLCSDRCLRAGSHVKRIGFGIDAGSDPGDASNLLW